jgi:hypothetical protein
MTDFFMIVAYGTLTNVKQYIAEGVNPRTNDDSALITASDRGRLDIVKYLIELGCDPKNQNGGALVWSASNGHQDLVEYLVGLGVDPRSQKDKALCYSAANKKFKTAKYLISLGCDPKAEGYYAFEWCNDSIFDYLLAALHKRDRYNYLIENCVKHPWENYYKIFVGEILTKNSVCKNNLLKFILKPMSQHMQLTSIE